MAGQATRCPACATVFRVVPDQLRVSEGWVRCGRCAEVFNAAAALIDLETGAPCPAPQEPPPRAAMPDSLDGDTGTGTEFELRIDPAATPTAAVAEEVSATTQPAAVAAAVADTHAAPAPEPIDVRALPDDIPSFVRRAERAQRWRQPRVRAALLAAVVLGVLGLGAQIAYEYRDLLAARAPTTRPALEAACALLDCSVGAAHVIDSLAVESSALVRVEKSNVYRLSVALRNRAGIAVAMPALDLTLNDSQGRLLARRVLHAADLGVNGATLAAGHDLTLQATLQTAFADSREPVAGYTVEVFYP